MEWLAKKGNIEMYSAGRYLTVTGHRLKNSPQTIETRQDHINQLFETTFAPKQETSANGNGAGNHHHRMIEDDELLAKAFASRNGGKIRQLFDGDFSDYPSQSEADLALCDLLAFWVENAAQLDRMFRRSALYRDKWDQRRGAHTYGESTVAKALTDRTGHYTDTDSKPSGANAERSVKPELDAKDHDLERITQAALKVLVGANEPPFIFRHADMISRVQDADDGAKIIRPPTEKSLRHILAKVAYWCVTKKKKVFAELPPKHVAENILADPLPPFPVLTRIVRSPIVAADGTLRTKAGYDAASKTFYDPAEGFDIRVPLKPAGDQVEAARDAIDDLLVDFPFTSQSERTHAVGLLLLPFARELIDGPTPLHLIEKPSPGTGAGLLTDVLTTIFLGHGAATMTEGKDEDEWRKRITAKLVQHNDIVVIDNIRHRLESSALSAALTANVWEDRWLGKTAMVRAVVRMTWIATGNNPALSNEIARRTVRIRLDSKIDRPWLRDGFRHSNLREYVSKEREKLAWSALVLIQHWIASNKPPSGSKVLGTFENWSKVIGGILASAGFEGFLENLDELYEASDAEGDAWRALVSKWWELHEDNSVGVAELFEIVAPAQGDPIDIDLGKGTERSQKVKLGNTIQRMRDRQFSGKRIIKDGTKNGAQLWRLKDIQK